MVEAVLVPGQRRLFQQELPQGQSFLAAALGGPAWTLNGQSGLWRVSGGAHMAVLSVCSGEGGEGPAWKFHHQQVPKGKGARIF